MSNKISSNATLKSGLLAKRARKRGLFNFTHWDDRVVSLHPTVIRYALPTGEVKGTFELSDTAIVEKSDVDKKPYAFRIDNGTEEFFLSCHSAESLEEWMEAIRCAIAGDTVSLSIRGATDKAPLTATEELAASKKKVTEHALQQAADRIEEREAVHAWGSGRGRTLSAAVGEAELAYINSSLVAIGKLSHSDLVDYLKSLNKEQHPYIVLNISGKEYLHHQHSLCRNQLIELPWHTIDQSTHIPTLQSILSICYALKSWFDIGSGDYAKSIQQLEHLALIHCQDGRTRTGILTACLMKYNGTYASTKDAFCCFCKAKKISIPVLPASYRIFFENFDSLVDGRMTPRSAPLLKLDLILADITISGCPVDELPSIEIWDAVAGRVFHSHEEGVFTWGVNLAAPCIYSNQSGRSYYSSNCQLSSDFVIICRFGEVPSYSKQKAAVIFRYQNHALFLDPKKVHEGGEGKLSLLLSLDDIDIFPQYKSNFDESFSVKLTFKHASSGEHKSLDSEDVHSALKSSKKNRANLQYFAANKKSSFDSGLGLLATYHVVSPDFLLINELLTNPKYGCDEDGMEGRYLKTALQLSNNDIDAAASLLKLIAARAVDIDAEAERDAEAGRELRDDTEHDDINLGNEIDTTLLAGTIVNLGGVLTSECGNSADANVLYEGEFRKKATKGVRGLLGTHVFGLRLFCINRDATLCYWNPSVAGAVRHSFSVDAIEVSC